LRGAVPIDPVTILEAFHEYVLENRPGPEALPLPQATPAGHAASTSSLAGKMLPGDAGLQNE